MKVRTDSRLVREDVRPAGRRAAPLPLSILVLAAGGEDTRRCLAALREQASAPLELVVVDGRGETGLATKLAGAGLGGTDPVCLSPGKDMGFADALNRGLALVTQPLVAVLDGDLVPQPGSLQRLAAAVAANEAEGDGHRLGWAAPTGLVAGNEGHAGVSPNPRRGLCFVLGRPLLDAIGGFDPHCATAELALLDYARRAALAGFSLAAVHAPVEAASLPARPREATPAPLAEALFHAKWKTPAPVLIEAAERAAGHRASTFGPPVLWPLGADRWLRPTAPPLPIQTGARRIRVLAIPDWTSPAWQEPLLRAATALAQTRSACLVVRIEPPGSSEGAAFEAELRNVFRDAGLDVVLETTPLPRHDRARLYTAASAFLRLPGQMDGVWAGEAAACGIPVTGAGPADLDRLVSSFDDGTAPAERPSTGAGYRVTALVSTYASERFMAGCLDDLLAQSLYRRGELEILIVDSGSPEDEGAIVRGYQARFPHIRYLRTERETLYAAWNRGIALARADYLTNANTDDRHHPEALSELADALDRRPDVGLAYADQLITHTPDAPFPAPDAHIPWSFALADPAALRRHCMLGSQPMWRKDLHDRYGGFDPAFKVCGDYDFFLRIAPVVRMVKIPRILGQYLKNPDGLEHAHGPTGAAEAQQARTRNPESGPVHPQDESARLVHEARSLLDRGRPAEAKQLLAAELGLAGRVPEVLLLLSAAMTALGETSAARQVLDYGLELHPLDARFRPSPAAVATGA